MGKNYYSITHSILKGKTNSTLIQLIRYTFVGGIAFIADFATLLLLTEYLNFHYLVSAGIAFLFGLSINYLLSVNWVFVKRSYNNRYLEFLLFMCIGVIGLGINELLLWIFTDVFSIYYLVSKLITAIFVYLWNFFARKILLFNK